MPTTTQKIQFLPLGEVSYVNYDPATFGKTEFKVEFTDSGSTKSISLNSDPSATTESASKLLGTLLPFIAKPKVEPETADLIDLAELRKKSCILKDTKILLIKRRAISS